MSRVWSAMMAVATPRGWALIFAGPLVTLVVVYFSLLVWLPARPLFLQRMQLEFLGWALEGSLLLLGIVVAALASAKVSGAGPAGMRFDIDASDRQQAQTKVVTETTITPPGAPDGSH